MLAKIDPPPQRKRGAERKTGDKKAGETRDVSRAGWIVFWLTSAYLAAVLALWWMHWSYVDDWWFATVLSFGPTYLYMAPMALLVPAAVVWHRRLLWALAIAALIVIFPIMNLRLGSIAFGGPGPGSQPLRILTCNVFRQKNLTRLKALIESENVDLVLLQEAPSETASALGFDESWHYKQWGELVIACRYPITDSSELSAPKASHRQLMLTCDIAMPVQSVRVSCVHFMTMRPGLSAVLARSRNSPQIVAENNAERWSDAISVANQLGDEGPTAILAGDFNTTTEGRILKKIRPYWHNAFSEAGRGLGWTKRTRWHGVRIDHILASEECYFQECRVLGDVGSDHRPVLATLWIPPQKEEESDAR